MAEHSEMLSTRGSTGSLDPKRPVPPGGQVCPPSPLARHHEMTELWVTCNPDNIASRRTCELAGGVLVEIVDLPEDIDMYQEGERRKCRYRFGMT